jgi:hypothetical protein
MNPTTSSETLTQPVALTPEAVPEADDRPYTLTPEQEARFAAYMAAPKELPKPGVDKNGRWIPVSEEERRARWARHLERMAEIDARDNERPMSLEQFKREMNDERRVNGERLVFLEP